MPVSLSVQLWKRVEYNVGGLGGQYVEDGAGNRFALGAVRHLANVGDEAFEQGGVEADVIYHVESIEGLTILGWLAGEGGDAAEFDTNISNLEYVSVTNVEHVGWQDDWAGGGSAFAGWNVGAFTMGLTHPFLSQWPEAQAGGKVRVTGAGSRSVVNCLAEELLRATADTAFRKAYVTTEMQAEGMTSCPGGKTRVWPTVADIYARAGKPTSEALCFNDVAPWLQDHGLGLVVVDTANRVRLSWVSYMHPGRAHHLGGTSVIHLLWHNKHVWALDADYMVFRAKPAATYQLLQEASALGPDTGLKGVHVVTPTFLRSSLSMYGTEKKRAQTGIVTSRSSLKGMLRSAIVWRATFEAEVEDAEKAIRKEETWQVAFIAPNTDEGGGEKGPLNYEMYDLWRWLREEHDVEPSLRWSAGQIRSLSLVFTVGVRLPDGVAAKLKGHTRECVGRLRLVFTGGDMTTPPGCRSFEEVKQEWLNASVMRHVHPDSLQSNMLSEYSESAARVWTIGFAKGQLRRRAAGVEEGTPCVSIDAVRMFASQLVHVDVLPVFSATDVFKPVPGCGEPGWKWDVHALYIIHLPDDARPDPEEEPVAWWQCYLLADKEYSILWGFAGASAQSALGIDLRPFVWGVLTPSRKAAAPFPALLERLYADPACAHLVKLLPNVFTGMMGRTASVRSSAYFSTDENEAVQQAAWHRRVQGVSATTYSVQALMGGYLTVAKHGRDQFRDGWPVQSIVHEASRLEMAIAIGTLAEWSGHGNFVANFVGIRADALLFREEPVAYGGTDPEPPKGFLMGYEMRSLPGMLEGVKEFADLGTWRLEVDGVGDPVLGIAPPTLAAVLVSGQETTALEVTPFAGVDVIEGAEGAGEGAAFAAASAALQPAAAADPLAFPPLDESGEGVAVRPARVFRQQLPALFGRLMVSVADPLEEGAPLASPWGGEGEAGNWVITGVAGAGKTHRSLSGAPKKREAVVIICPTHTRRNQLASAWTWVDASLEGAVVGHIAITAAGLIFNQMAARRMTHVRFAAKEVGGNSSAAIQRTAAAFARMRPLPGQTVIVEELAFLTDVDIDRLLALMDASPGTRWIVNFDTLQQSLEGSGGDGDGEVGSLTGVSPSAEPLKRVVALRHARIMEKLATRFDFHLHLSESRRLVSVEDRGVYARLRANWTQCDTSIVRSSMAGWSGEMADPRTALDAERAAAAAAGRAIFPVHTTMDDAIAAGLRRFVVSDNYTSFVWNCKVAAVTVGEAKEVIARIVDRDHAVRGTPAVGYLTNHALYPVVASKLGQAGGALRGSYTVSVDTDAAGVVRLDGERREVTVDKSFFRRAAGLTSFVAQGAEWPEAYLVDTTFTWVKAPPSRRLVNMGVVQYLHTAVTRGVAFKDVHLLAGEDAKADGEALRRYMSLLAHAAGGAGVSGATALRMMKTQNATCGACAEVLQVDVRGCCDQSWDLMRPMFVGPGVVPSIGRSWAKKGALVHAECARRLEPAAWAKQASVGDRSAAHAAGGEYDDPPPPSGY